MTEQVFPLIFYAIIVGAMLGVFAWLIANVSAMFRSTEKRKSFSVAGGREHVKWLREFIAWLLVGGGNPTCGCVRCAQAARRAGSETIGSEPGTSESLDHEPSRRAASI